MKAQGKSQSRGSFYILGFFLSFYASGKINNDNNHGNGNSP